jgi:hypothetical protein
MHDALRAFTTIGGSLDLDQRHVRVFNNFADPTANDNTTPHPSFPGALGAEQALWKTVVEWGSLPHGDGSGDPTQPNLGDGGANFDAAWQANATSAGGANGNVFSATNCGGGIIAFTETPISDGWRIHFCEEFDWDDGPGSDITGFDIQGVGVHEYGHALGLGHTGVAGASMAPTVVGGGVVNRSIEADDIAGVQFIYGVAAPGKPRIDSITGQGVLTILGADFAPVGNEVWFTPQAPTDMGVPVRVIGVPSSAGGTVIQVVAPFDAGPGDVLVRVPGGNTGEFLSNAFPHDPEVPSPETYCSAKTTSTGCVPFVSFTGAPSVSTGGFVIASENHVEGQIALLLYSFQKTSLGFHGGTLCVKAPFVRVQTLVKSTDGLACSGCAQPTCRRFTRNFNQIIQSGADPLLTVGQRVNAQYRQRDPADPLGFGDNLSDAVSFVIGP